MIEAMACQRPLVVSDIPAHREILDRHSALWVDPQDPAAIARAVLEVFDDPRAAALRAATAKTRAEAWSIASAAAQYDAVYRQVLTRRSVITGNGR